MRTTLRQLLSRPSSSVENSDFDRVGDRRVFLVTLTLHRNTENRYFQKFFLIPRNVSHF